MKRSTKKKTKRSKGWRYYLGYWASVIISVIILIIVCIIRIVVDNIENEKKAMQESEPFSYTYVMTPVPSDQIPSELLEYIAIESEESR